MIRRELPIFLIVGIGVVSVDYLIYNGLLWKGLVSINIAKGGGFTAGIAFAYLANRFWTFSHRQYKSGSLWRFCILYACTLSVNVQANALGLSLLADDNLAFQIAFIVATGTSATLNFLGLKFFVFTGKIIPESKFGFLSKIDFLQDFASFAVAGMNPAVVHNLEKYMAIKKVFFLSAMEDIEGDYIEFGVYTGSSFCHSIRCAKKLAKINSSIISTSFYGFDSFEGFGELMDEDRHPFYEDTNFEADYENVDSRVKRTGKNINYKLIKGFFCDSLAPGAESYGIKKSRIVFIDSDTYNSAIDALLFVLPTIQEGSYIILDDYFSYKGSKTHGVARAFSEFLEQGKLTVRHVLNYGMGGVAFVISGMK